jgi:hypothetical protein
MQALMLAWDQQLASRLQLQQDNLQKIQISGQEQLLMASGPPAPAARSATPKTSKKIKALL